jgi:hypothetical protein
VHILLKFCMNKGMISQHKVIPSGRSKTGLFAPFSTQLIFNRRRSDGATLNVISDAFRDAVATGFG